VKINYPLFPVHKRSAPTQPQCRTRQWTKPSPDEKKNLPIDNIDQRNLLFIADHKENMYIYLQQQLPSSVNFSIHFATLNRVQFLQTNFRIISRELLLVQIAWEHYSLASDVIRGRIIICFKSVVFLNCFEILIMHFDLSPHTSVFHLCR
jgi:hypothetical protein